MGRGRVCLAPTGAITKSLPFPVCGKAPAAVPSMGGLQVSRLGFLSCKPLPSWPFLPFPAKAGAHVPGTVCGHPLEWGPHIQETKEDVNKYSPKGRCRISAAPGSRLLSCIKVNTSPDTYFPPSLGWPESSLSKVNASSSPNTLKETGLFPS